MFNTDRRARDGKFSWCRSCCSAYEREHRTPETSRAARLKTKYGITIARYDELLAEQDGRCAICRCLPDGYAHRFHVDHDHATMRVRAILCHHCNLAVGNVREDPAIAIALVQYVVANKSIRDSAPPTEKFATAA